MSSLKLKDTNIKMSKRQLKLFGDVEVIQEHEVHESYDKVQCIRLKPIQNTVFHLVQQYALLCHSLLLQQRSLEPKALEKHKKHATLCYSEALNIFDKNWPVHYEILLH